MRTFIFLSIAWIAGCQSRDEAPLVGTVERHRLEIAAPATEQVVAMNVREGDRVQPGQLLAQLDTASIGAQRDAAASEVRRAQRYLEQLRNGSRTEEVRVAQAQLAALQATADQAERETTRLQQLVGRDLVSRSAFDQQRGVRDAAWAQRDAAQAQLKLLRQGTRVEQIAQAEAALATAQAQLAQQQALLQRLELRAPASATVEAITYRLGERPTVGQPVLVLLAEETPFARVYVSTEKRARLKLGQNVDVRVDGSAPTYTGRVRFIASDATFTPYYALTQRDRGRLVYLAEIDLTDAAAADLPTGLPLEVSLR